MIWKWTAWEDERGQIASLPPHRTPTSSIGAEAKERHYALACYSDHSVGGGRAPFDPEHHPGNYPGHPKSPRSCMVRQRLTKRGPYEVAFEATLVQPWAVKLVRPIRVR
jgi:hypothetical protein